ncbi:acyltransferase family protein [Falsirhodobacter xinxiangensis]|uniref:acyltransferase family protein n=1 Tax=Falsirhodobacter xinxiangensis TaxID=2530049 RepID=UPI0010AA8E1C|nr:acyltransferase family protein [Rhodobacter xinxiangensis]
MTYRLLGVPSAPTVQEGYNPTIDYLRLAAALVIVQFHSKSTLAPLGESAVAFFTICMVWFTLRGLTSGRPAALGQRTWRLMQPFFVWCAIMLACKLGQAFATGGDPMVEIWRFLPPRGSFAQLWFLPWAVGVTFMLAWAARRTVMQISSWGQLGAALVVLGVGSLPLLALWADDSLPLILRLGALYLPSVGMGVVIFAARGNGVLLLSAAMGCSLLGSLLDIVGIEGAQQFLFAPLVMAVALMVRLPELGWTRRLGQVSMDVYLVHMLVIAVAYSLPVPAPHTAAGGILIVLASLAIAATMQLRSR